MNISGDVGFHQAVNISSFCLSEIGRYVMPEVPLVKCDMAFVFGTRHGVDEFCVEIDDLWRRGMFEIILISGGCTGNCHESEADIISGKLVQLGVPMSHMILEKAAQNTGQNVNFGLLKLAEVMEVSSIRSVLAIGKICSMRRYLMTLEKHWPGLILSFRGVNYFGVSQENWYKNEEFKKRVVDEFIKIPQYLQKNFLAEITYLEPYPDLLDDAVLALQSSQ